MNKSNFVKDRDEAFESGSREKIEQFSIKYGIEIPKDDEIFWAGVHKTICNLFLFANTKITFKQFCESSNWLRERGYKESIF